MKNFSSSKGIQFPDHIGIIMDGNGRWAKNRMLVRSCGHTAGAKQFRKIVFYCEKIGIKVLTVYAFSTENWKRPKMEVNFLLDLFIKQLEQALKNFSDKNIRVNFLGNVNNLPEKLVGLIEKIENISQKKDGMTLNVALNYGGRDEIVNAVKRMLLDFGKRNLEISQIDEQLFSKYLYTKGAKDPDLIIRTGGEIRVSNFLLWQSAYSEYFFTKILWPDFTEKDLDTILEEYSKRKRKYGGVI